MMILPISEYSNTNNLTEGGKLKEVKRYTEEQNIK